MGAHELMLSTHAPKPRLAAASERGAVLVITALVMLSIFVIAALAIDTAIWFVHGKHLQTQADAAAFAGADVMAAGILSGGCSETAIKSAVAQYDGTQQPVANQQLPANQQVAQHTTYGATSYSSTSHDLFDQVNAANYENQSIPADTGLTGHPCADSTVDVKMTETNLPSFLTAFGPPYIDKQARVSALLVGGQSASPFVLPNIQTPSDAAVFVVGENATTPAFATDTILTKLASCADISTQPCLTSSNGNATWSTTGSTPAVSVPFGGSPVSLVVAQSTSSITPSAFNAVTDGASLGTFCATSGISCYDKNDGTGLSYTRTYTASSPNFPTAAPAVEDTYVADAAGDPISCQSAGSTGLFTGFMTSSSTCNVNFGVDMNFGAASTNGVPNSSCQYVTTTLAATLTVTASSPSGASATLTCPDTGGNPAAAGSANGIWQSSSTMSIPATTGTTGPITFDLTWSRTSGGGTVKREGWELPTSGNSAGQCTSPKPCTNDFKIVQRIFTGAYDQNTASTSGSGPVAGAALTGSVSGVPFELMSTPANATVNNLTVTIDFQSLSDTAAATGGAIPNVPFNDIAYGTNQANGLADCGQGVGDNSDPNGFSYQEDAIAGLFTCTNYPVIPAPGTCGATNCPNTVPGNKFLQWLDGGLATRIYGCQETNKSTQQKEQNGCSANGTTPLSATSCAADPNYWSTQNTLVALEANSSDPRLLSVMVTDPGPLANGNHPVPVRDYATFYVTGWTNDPCSGVAVSGHNTSNGLYYVSDDVAPTDANGDIFLVGHFIKYFAPGATPSSQKCVLTSIDNCTLTLTK